jgi:outer membrane immunogenic protein
MRYLSLGGLALAAMALVAAGPAFAQTAPPPPAAPYMPGPWDGFYGGLNAGGGWANDRANINPSFPGSNGHIQDSGVVGGGQLGFNHEFPGLITPVVGGFAGLEGDFDYTGLSGKRTYSIAPTIAWDQKFTSDWLATARVRLGVTLWTQLVLYGTGGFAVADNKFSGNLVAPSPTGYYGSSSGTRLGWVFGGGAEWMFFPNLSLKLEYLHVSFGSENFNATNPATGAISVNHDYLTENIARVGINYKFWSM